VAALKGTAWDIKKLRVGANDFKSCPPLSSIRHIFLPWEIMALLGIKQLACNCKPESSSMVL
jgi:hypothetical protein